MPRKRVKVSQLAIEANCPLDEAITLLQTASIAVRSKSDYVPKNKFTLARVALGLKRRGLDERTISSLVARTEFTEAGVRKLLLEAGVLKKNRLIRLTAAQYRRAELILGIRSVSSTTHPKKKVTEELRLDRMVVGDSKPPTREIIGREQNIQYLTSLDVEKIHYELVKDFAASRDPIDPPGVRSKPLLESAAGRPKTSLGLIDKYPTVPMAGAALTHAIVHNHPFHNGNKRTALVSLLVFVDKNGFLLDTTEDELYELLLQVASHNLRSNDNNQHIEGPDNEVLHIANWLMYHLRVIAKEERMRKWRELRKILEHYGCKLEVIQGNRVNITRGELRTQVSFRNWGADVEVNTIHKIRRDLELDEDHGYDSDIFYSRDTRIPGFINKYRRLIVKLAKV